VGFPVDPDRGVGVGRLDEAEHLPAPLVHPVLEVVDSVLVLGADIGGVAFGGVGFGDVFGGGPSGGLSCTSMKTAIAAPFCGLRSRSVAATSQECTASELASIVVYAGGAAD
jgi:hypothetical protein